MELVSENKNLSILEAGSYKPHLQQKLQIVALMPEAGEIFFRCNIFEFDSFQLEAFVNYRYPGTNAEDVNKFPIPKDHITHVKLVFDSYLERQLDNYDPASAWRRLPECPKLKKVDIAVEWFWSNCHVWHRPLFSKFAVACAELGERLDEGFEVYYRRSSIWTIADFKKGIIPAQLSGY